MSGWTWILQVGKGSHEAILEDMKNGKIDILIGTQMISKGLDFENVTLVGIILQIRP